MKREVTFNTNEQGWFIEDILKEAGYMKTDDCYWCLIFEKDDNEVILVREEK